MPRPKQGHENRGGVEVLRAALQSLRQQQEQPLAAIEALLETCDTETEPPPNQLYAIKEAQVDNAGVEAVKEDPQPPTSIDKKTCIGLSESGSKFRDLITEDIGENDGSGRTLKGWIRSLISKPQFDWAMGVVIFLNSICIGIETQRSIPHSDLLPDWPREALDVMFISIYIVEISMRIYAFGTSNFKDWWFLFDFTLVGMGVVGIIVEPIMLSDDQGETPFAKILVVRSLRLLRLVRAIRMLHMFRTVWCLVYGLLTSGNAMLSTFFILLLTLYIFACLGVELITKDEDLQKDQQTKQIVDYHFGSLQRTLLTLVSFVSADSIAQVYMPICIVQPYLIIYFIGVILTVSVSLMNLAGFSRGTTRWTLSVACCDRFQELFATANFRMSQWLWRCLKASAHFNPSAEVTAVLVEGALANAANDKELSRHDMKQKVRKFAPKVMQVFAEIDEDGSGTIDRHEVSKINLDQLPIELNSEHVSSLEDLFDMLDVEDKGTLTQVEFADGLLNLLTMDVPIHQMKTFKLLQLHSSSLDQIKSKLLSLENSLVRR